MNLLVLAHPEKPEAKVARDEAIRWLRKNGHKAYSKFNAAVELVIGFGGDGFTMHLAAEFSPKNIPVLVINAGDVGFLTKGNLSNWQEVLKRVVSGDYFIDRRNSLELDFRGKKYGPFVNDVYLRHTFSIGTFNVKKNDFLTYKDLSADGIIVSTTTGSTGYNLSAGGPIVDPGKETLLVTPISPGHLNTPSLDIPPDSVVEVELARSKKPGEMLLIGDGRLISEINPGEKIIVKEHEAKILFAILDRNDFYRALREKKGMR